uniref:Reverse transcriptase zinc-binding domain-containing protein n=1 Tax=Cajanus cajan TaxID=3821 RepID=A0A151RT86_CAJCA|nr:hypothetical protein KK1_032736 [Cajanus cajan]
MLEPSMDDTMIWGPSSSGANIIHLTLTRNWTWIWKLKLIEHIKHFIWLAFRGKLPINQIHVRQHLSFDLSYCKCGAGEEDLTHVLCDCPSSKKVWDHLCFTQQQSFNQRPASSWIYTFLLY